MITARSKARETLNAQRLVCERAERELDLGPHYERINLMMDLDSLPDLDLQALLAFPALDFAHDIYGIISHMDRSCYPGRLTDCFVPRAAIQQPQPAQLSVGPL